MEVTNNTLFQTGTIANKTVANEMGNSNPTVEEQTDKTNTSQSSQEETSSKDTSDSSSQTIHKNPTKKKNWKDFSINQFSLAVILFGIIADLFFDRLWIRICMIVVFAAAIILPKVIHSIKTLKVISPKTICSILKKKGIKYSVKGNEIIWNQEGKEYVLRIHSHYQVEMACEYKAPETPEFLPIFKKAAELTMKEVYLAKVAVMNEEDGNKLSISTQSLCATPKEFECYLPMCLEILGMAEKRQKLHCVEYQNFLEKKNKNKNRIGFLCSDGNKR